MAAAPAHSSDNSSMIDMSDIQAALEMVKGGSRADSATSLVSWASHGTSAPTPPSTSPQLSSGSSSPRGSVRRRGFDETEGHSSHGRPAVRWSDECGLDLVTRVQTTTDFWDELVFGPSGCTCADNGSSGSGSSSARTTGDADTTTSGGGRCECEACGGEGQRQPGELFQFIEELSRGVEATLLFPSMGGISKKRRPVILYTEDNGESICWIKTGGAAGSSKEPYRIRCKSLLAVKDKSGAGTAGGRNGSGAAAGGAGSRAAVFLEGGGGGSSGTASRSRPTIRAGGGVGCGNAGGVENQDPSPPSRMSDSEGESEGCGAAGGGGGGGFSPGVRIKLKWLPQPTWSKRSVKIFDVKTRCPGMFTRGMLQLLSFNTDLQS